MGAAGGVGAAETGSFLGCAGLSRWIREVLMLGRCLFGGDSIGRAGVRSAKPASKGSCWPTNA